MSHWLSDVLDYGAVEFVRHVLQAVHHTLQVVQDFRRDPEMQRAFRSPFLEKAASGGIIQVVCLALDVATLPGCSFSKGAVFDLSGGRAG